MARVVKRNRDRPIDWGAVAVVRENLQTIIDAHAVDAQWLNEPEEGGWLREVALELDTGGLAYLDEHRLYPGEFTIHLQRHRDMFFFREDYADVLAFLNAEASNITLLTGQVRWWKKKRPASVAGTGSLRNERASPRGDRDA